MAGHQTTSCQLFIRKLPLNRSIQCLSVGRGTAEGNTGAVVSLSISVESVHSEGSGQPGCMSGLLTLLR